MNVHSTILSAIGQTPLVRLNKLVGPNDATVYAKCEFLNPGGSIKDRMALHIIEKGEREGKLKPGGVKGTRSGTWAVAATAHPAKFESIVEPLVGHAVEVPPALAELLARPTRADPLAVDPAALRRWLLDHAVG